MTIIVISSLYLPPKIRWPSLSFFRSCPAPVFPIYDLIFLFMSGSGLSDLWSVRISVRLFCVPFKGKKIRWPSLSFFHSCPAPVFRIYDPPPLNCIFWPFLSCFTSSCVVSVRISVRLFCVPFKGKKFRWPSLSFFRSCPAPVFPIYDLIFLSYVRLRSFGSMIRSNFGSSVLCPVQR